MPEPESPSKLPLWLQVMQSVSSLGWLLNGVKYYGWGYAAGLVTLLLAFVLVAFKEVAKAKRLA
ncbi:MAG: hypothetical protein JSS65_11535 [Armatimonadetes bacterium]|nr:hypothetical protein [Armatimonadota bacterium]